ncbi:MAG: hypothetical protein Q4G05_05820 [Clostridia bacterium]|nr:hypothetical protein [Clostridia bacterium]
MKMFNLFSDFITFAAIISLLKYVGFVIILYIIFGLLVYMIYFIYIKVMGNKEDDVLDSQNKLEESERRNPDYDANFAGPWEKMIHLDLEKNNSGKDTKIDRVSIQNEYFGRGENKQNWRIYDTKFDKIYNRADDDKQ